MKKIFKNELRLQKNPPWSRPLSRLRRTRILVWILIITILGGLFFFTPVFKSREIVIIGQGIGPKTVINLGHLGLILPSNIKNKQRVNLLFLGIPGQNNQAPNLTDSIIILNSGPKGQNPIGISIPRDLLIKFPDKNYYTKINSLFKWGGTKEKGIELVAMVLNEITGLEFDYFIVLDLEGVKKVIDIVNGIDVYVENDIYDPMFPGSDDSYQIFSIKRGQHHLNGETAVKYIRTRHDVGGDFTRIKRQQQVISDLKDKVFSLNPFWNFPTFLNIWKTLDKHTYTNIDINDIKYAWTLAKNTDFEEIEFHTLDLIPDTITLGGKTAYILKPKAGINNYKEIKENINKLLKEL